MNIRSLEKIGALVGAAAISATGVFAQETGDTTNNINNVLEGINPQISCLDFQIASSYGMYSRTMRECLSNYDDLKNQRANYSISTNITDFPNIEDISLEEIIRNNPLFFKMLTDDLNILQNQETVLALRNFRYLWDSKQDSHYKIDTDILNLCPTIYCDAEIGRILGPSDSFRSAYNLLGTLDRNSIPLELFTLFVNRLIPKHDSE